MEGNHPVEMLSAGDIYVHGFSYPDTIPENRVFFAFLAQLKPSKKRGVKGMLPSGCLPHLRQRGGHPPDSPGRRNESQENRISAEPLFYSG
jgi:hypothetical protein